MVSHYALGADSKFTVSSVAWLLYAAGTSAQGLLAQQAVFLGVNLMGMYRWFRARGQA